jgi:2-C-methyl-D-erythritol 2,4-cyclodiphosphate synthase
MYRIGEGNDVHRLEPGRPLRLGCVDVPAPFGSVAHSDGDVLAHAITDAILGAIGEGDIGRHFPPDDARWRNADSRVFLAEACRLLTLRGGLIANVDATVLLERPRLASHVPAMRAALAEALGCDPDRVSIKAKTAEGLGAVGAGEAIEARAIVLVAISGSVNPPA